MRRTACLVFVAGALVAPVGAHAAAGRTAATPLTAARVLALFRAQTGAKLAVDPRSSYRGHYTALVLPQSIANIGRYGHFTIWLVTSGDQQDVHDLLSDVHTGVLGTHDSSGIYWERASNVYGSDVLAREEAVRGTDRALVVRLGPQGRRHVRAAPTGPALGHTVLTVRGAGILRPAGAPGTRRMHVRVEQFRAPADMGELACFDTRGFERHEPTRADRRSSSRSSAWSPCSRSSASSST